MSRLRKEYDFSADATLGKYAGRYASGANIVLLDLDIARVFPDSKSGLAKRAAREP